MTRLIRLALLALMATASTAAAQRNATVTGVVRDSATGQRVSGAVIEMASVSMRYAVRTDEAGEFQIHNVELGAYRAVVRRIGYGPVTREIQAEPEMRPITFTLPPIPQALRAVRVRGEGTGIYGQIARADDLSPIVGARVYVAGSRDSVLTDSVGAYYVPLKGPGLFMVRVASPGFIEDMYVVDVKRNAVSDGSRLLDAGVGPSMHPILWKDFDQRMSWRSVNSSALLSGSEVRRSGGTVTNVFVHSGVMVAAGMRLGPTVCIFVDGQPRPGVPLDSYRPEDIKSIEVYGGGSDAAKLLMSDWPRGQKCSETDAKQQRGARVISTVVIWRR